MSNNRGLGGGVARRESKIGPVFQSGRRGRGCSSDRRENGGEKKKAMGTLG